MAMSMVSILRGWISLVAFMAVGNTIQCFVEGSFLANKLYTGQPTYVNPLSARLFGVWTLLAAMVRFYGALYIRHKPMYNLTLCSFVLVLIHFPMETFIYGTCTLSIGVITPMLVAGVSMILMIIGYGYVDFDDEGSMQARRKKLA